MVCDLTISQLIGLVFGAAFVAGLAAMLIELALRELMAGLSTILKRRKK